MSKPVSLETTAGTTAVQNRPFTLNSKLVYIANDSDTYDMRINFDASIEESGSITIKAGEVISDVDMSCKSISFVGIGGSVAFRALGA